MTRTRSDAACLLAGLALLVSGAVVAQCGPGVTAHSAEVQVVGVSTHPVSLSAR